MFDKCGECGGTDIKVSNEKETVKLATPGGEISIDVEIPIHHCQSKNCQFKWRDWEGERIIDATVAWFREEGKAAITKAKLDTTIVEISCRVGFYSVWPGVLLAHTRRDMARVYLEKRAIRIATGFNGKSAPITSYIVEKELTNDDGYWEGDGGRAVLTPKGFIKWGDLPLIEDVIYPLYFNSFDEAAIAGINAAPNNEAGW